MHDVIISTSNGTISNPSVSNLDNGMFVVVWNFAPIGQSQWQIYGQLLGHDYSKIGKEFVIKSSNGMHPQITALQGQGFFVTYEQPTSLEHYSLITTIFDNNANVFKQLTTTNFEVPNANSFIHHDSTLLRCGDFVITWYSYELNPINNGGSIWAQRYTPSGNIVKNKFQINTQAVGDEDTALSIASYNDNQFVTVWKLAPMPPSKYNNLGVHASCFDINNNIIAGGFKVDNTQSQYYITFVSVISLNNGGFLVSWGGTAVSNAWDKTFIRIYNSNCNSKGDPSTITLDGYTNFALFPIKPAITGLENGNFIIAYGISKGTKYGSDGIWGQIFDPNGNNINNKFQINNTNGTKIYPDITDFQKDCALVVWVDVQDNQYSGFEISGNVIIPTGDISSIKIGVGADII